MRNMYLTSTMLIAASAWCGPTTAQQTAPTNGGLLTLPPPITKLVAIDAHNVLLAESTDPDTPGQKQHSLLTVRHVYPGGIARIFGGTVVPASIFVSPAGSMMQRGGANAIAPGATLNPTGGANPFNGGNANFNGGNANGPAFGAPSVGALQQIISLLDRAPRQVAIGP